MSETASAGIAVYPNPTRSILNVSAENPFDQVRIIDVTGRTVIAKDQRARRVGTIDLSFLKSGLYEVIILFEEKIITCAEIVKVD